MALVPTDRLSLPVMTEGSDSPSRTTFNQAWQQLDELVAVTSSGPAAERPDPGTGGAYYYAEDTGDLFYDDGADWQRIGISRKGGTLTGPLVLPAGTEAEPALAFSGGTSVVGLMRSGSTLGVVLDGARLFVFTTSGGGRFQPIADGAHDLGIDSARWRDLWLSRDLVAGRNVLAASHINAEAVGSDENIVIRSWRTWEGVRRQARLGVSVSSGEPVGEFALADNAGAILSRLLMRDGSHQFLENVRFPDGTNAEPSLSFWNDNDTGLRRTFSDRIGVVLGGVLGFEFGANFVPVQDNTRRLGNSGNRWSEVWAASGTINTSDESTKADVADSDLGLAFVLGLRPIRYRFADGRRPHYGLGANQVRQALDELGVADFAGYIDPAVEARNRANPRAGEAPDGWVEQRARELLDGGGVEDTEDADEALDAARELARDEWTSERDRFDHETDELLSAPKGLRYDEFVAPLIRAVQEQHEIIVALRSELDELYRRVRSVEVSNADARAIRDAVAQGGPK